MNRPLFIKLIKTWHPDTTTSLKRKVLCEKMSRHILQASEAGDDEALEEIDRHGECYLEIVRQREEQAAREREEARRRQAAMDEIYRNIAKAREEEETQQRQEQCRQRWCYASPLKPPGRNPFVVLLELINPYLVVRAMKSWATNGRLYNAWGFCSGVFWLWAWWIAWKEIGPMEAATQAAGYAREGGVGLAFVLARGVYILAALPVAFCVGAVIFPIAVVAGSSWVAAWFIGLILGLFHPWLVHVPYVLAAVFVVLFAWQSLEEPPVV